MDFFGTKYAADVLAKAQRDTTADDIKARDRVDIALEQYESMKSKIRTLEFENGRLRDILNRIEIPFDKPIVPETIETCWCDIPMHFRKRFRVEFEIDELA